MPGIKKYREMRGLTQEELAKLVGVERSTVGKWENGEAAPRAGLLPLIAKVLRCKIDDLFVS